MDQSLSVAELLARRGFRRLRMSRTAVGHLQLVGRLGSRLLPIVVDTGASRTFVELNYCRSEGIPVMDTGQPGHGGNVYTLGDAQLTLEGLPFAPMGCSRLI